MTKRILGALFLALALGGALAVALPTGQAEAGSNRFLYSCCPY